MFHLLLTCYFVAIEDLFKEEFFKPLHCKKISIYFHCKPHCKNFLSPTIEACVLYSPQKTMKNVFYFIKKTLFVLQIFKFLYFFSSVPHFPYSKGQMEVE